MKRIILSLLIAFLILTACIRSLGPEGESTEKRLIPYIQDGTTTKESIETKMGRMPDAQHRNTLIYYMKFDDPDELYHLVLVFSERDILKRHSLVRVR